MARTAWRRRAVLKSLPALAAAGTLRASDVDVSLPEHKPVQRRQLTSFALIGDTPYGPGDESNLLKVLQAASTEARFIVHVGDLKSGIETCQSSLLKRRIDLLYSAPKPLVIVPGDNEWVDCSRLMAGQYAPLERLEELRRLLYAPGRINAAAGQDRLPIERPPAGGPESGLPDPQAQPEYFRWQDGACLFATLNVPGGSNGLQADIPQAANRERAGHNRAWLLDCAHLARARGLSGLVVVLHAQINLSNALLRDLDAPAITPKDPYAGMRALLIEVAVQFPGTVILLYGDRHRFTVDTPLRGFLDKAGATIDSNKRWSVAAQTARARLNRFQSIECFGWPFTSHYAIVRAWIDAAKDETDQGLPLLQTLVATRIV